MAGETATALTARGLTEAGAEALADATKTAGTAASKAVPESSANIPIRAQGAIVDKLVEPARTAAERLVAQAAEAEPAVTACLQRAVKAQGGRLEGLDSKLKSVESLSRKLSNRSDQNVLSETDPSAAVQFEARKVNDVLRYSIVSDAAKYLATKDAVFSDLTSKGYVKQYEWNAWHDDRTPYRGINSTWRTPDGQLFEVQLHTPRSHAANDETHGHYEEYRAADTSPERRADLDAVIRDHYHSTVPFPKGLEVPR